MKYYAGVDVGGTNTKIGIVDEQCKILIEDHIKTLSAEGPRATFTRIWHKIGELLTALSLNEDDLVGIGLGFPGPVVDHSIVKIAVNFSWGNDFHARALMEEISGKPVRFENDVKVITLGEQAFGACQGFKNAVVVPIGTGIAAGLIVNGQVVTGAHGCAGEFGHTVLDEPGHQCGCGLNGCLETTVSARGVVRNAKALLAQEKRGELYEKFADDLEKLEAADVFIYAKKGDVLAQQVVENFAQHLAHGLGFLINLLNPEIIALGGGVSKSADFIIERLWHYLPHYALAVSLKDLTITTTALSDSAGIMGAATLIMQAK